MSIVKLKGITWDHPRGYDPLMAASKLYSENNEIEIVWQKRSLKDFGDKSLQELSQVYDLLIIDHPHCGVAAAQKCVLPLERFIPKEDFEVLRGQSAGPSFDSYNYKGHQWALPVDAAMQCAAYRAELLNQKIPKNWREVLQIEGLGMALCPTDSLCTFLTLTAQFGHPIREQNEIMVTELVGVKALDLMLKLKTKSHPQSIQWNPIQLFDHMAEHNDVVYTPLAFCYTNYSRNGYRKNKLNYTHAPQLAKVLLGGAGIAVSTSCKTKEEAVRFSKWLCSANVQTGVYVKSQGQPANSMAWNDRYANILTNSFFDNTLSSLKKAYVRPRFQEWPKFQEHVGNLIHECLSKNSMCLKVIRHLNEEYKKISSYK